MSASKNGNFESLTRTLLQQVTSTRAREVAWLDLLSQMEYVGMRKIVKSLDFGRVDVHVLQHIAEEASHAYLLKTVVEKLGGTAWKNWATSPFSELGWRYFSGLDRELCELEPDQSSFYATVSWAVEQRVLELYPTYLEITQEPLVRRVIETILAQEKRHHREAELAIPDAGRGRAIPVESRYWEQFCQGVLHLLSKEVAG